jgi:glycosyltransferase involved in cell wall biosynthesis
MKNRLPIENKPSVVVEGVYKHQNHENITQAESYNTILYSGGLSKRYGIVELLRAFEGIKSTNYRLWFCGSGDAENEIELYAKNDKRVTHWGQLPHLEVLKLQKRATVLVNPRKSEGIFTKYSFPSKTIEYLASGRPTIMNRLDGIPDEYFDYCFVPESEDEEGLRQCIINVCEKPSSELTTFGIKAKDFILKNKNPQAQAQKIYDLINTL